MKWPGRGSIAVHDMEWGASTRPMPPVIMQNYGGANAFKAATLLQLTLASSLHHYSMVGSFPRVPQMVVNFVQNGKEIQFSQAQINTSQSWARQLLDKLRKIGLWFIFLWHESEGKVHVWCKVCFSEWAMCRVSKCFPVMETGTIGLDSFYTAIYATLTFLHFYGSLSPL